MTKLAFILDEVWLLSTLGAFQRAKIYLPNATENDKKLFRASLYKYIYENLIEFYEDGVSEREHLLNIISISNYSTNFKNILNNGKINFGVSQKLLNLYLKYLWCLEQIPTPPHFPIDRIIQIKLGLKKIESWTAFDNAAPYILIINKAKEILQNSDYESLAQLELELFKRN